MTPFFRPKAVLVLENYSTGGTILPSHLLAKESGSVPGKHQGDPPAWMK
jgi:hypothetical protein